MVHGELTTSAATSNSQKSVFEIFKVLSADLEMGAMTVSSAGGLQGLIVRSLVGIYTRTLMTMMIIAAVTHSYQ
jgi:hypothetical protein